jgi:glutathionyl-hydroquinone reductase
MLALIRASLQADDDGQFRRQEAAFRQKSINLEDAEKGRYIIYAKSVHQ